MIVTYIKDSKDFVSVNGVGMYSPHTDVIQDFIKNGGIIKDYIYTKQDRIDKIDQKSALTILEKYPDWKQHNLANRIKSTDTDEAFAEMQRFIREVLNEADVKKSEIRASVIDRKTEE